MQCKTKIGIRIASGIGIGIGNEMRIEKGEIQGQTNRMCLICGDAVNSVKWA